VDIDYGIEPTGDRKVRIREQGRLLRDDAGSRAPGTCETGDRFRIAVEAGEVSYYRNGERLYWSAVVPSGRLSADTSFHTPTATSHQVRVTGCP
jgi:hypothetical protein